MCDGVPAPIINCKSTANKIMVLVLVLHLRPLPIQCKIPFSVPSFSTPAHPDAGRQSVHNPRPNRPPSKYVRHPCRTLLPAGDLVPYALCDSDPFSYALILTVILSVTSVSSSETSRTSCAYKLQVTRVYTALTSYVQFHTLRLCVCCTYPQRPNDPTPVACNQHRLTDRDRDRDIAYVCMLIC